MTETALTNATYSAWDLRSEKVIRLHFEKGKSFLSVSARADWFESHKTVKRYDHFSPS